MATQRKGRQAVRNGGPYVPWWGLILIGIAIGAILMGYVAHRGLIPSLRRANQPHANASAIAQKGGPAGIAGKGTPGSAAKFDFYKVLPEKEVVIPDSALSAMAKAEQKKAAAANVASVASPAKAAAAPTAGGYILQVAAFSNPHDADAKKAKLALKGFTAHVQSVTLDGQVWNRVRLGPFPTATKLQEVQKRLAAAGVHSIPLKEK